MQSPIDLPMLILLILILIAFFGRRKIVQALQGLSDTERHNFYKNFRGIRIYQLGLTLLLLLPPLFVQMNSERLNPTMMIATIGAGILMAAAWYFIGYNYIEQKLKSLLMSTEFISTYLSDRYPMLGLYIGFNLVVAWQQGLTGIPTNF